MGFNNTAPQTNFKLANILQVAPTAGTIAGTYTQVAGTPPAGIALGDLFQWTGSAAILLRTYAKAPATVDVAGQAYAKSPSPTYWKTLATPATTGTFAFWLNTGGSPLAGWPVNATLAGNAFITDNYVQLTNNLAQVGTAIWNLAGSDWSLDISVEADVFIDPTADGITFNFGGSSAMTVVGSNSPQNTVNGGITVTMATYSTARKITVLQNGVQIYTAAIQAYPSSWQTLKFRIRNWGGKRYLTVYIGDSLYAFVDISSWVPTGGYFSLGAGTGGAGVNHAISSLEARYV